MGSLPRLKIKDEIHYRKGSTDESQNCRNCKSYLSNYEYGPRCAIIGIAESVRRYRVRPDYRCDRQVMSEAYRRRVESGFAPEGYAPAHKTA